MGLFGRSDKDKERDDKARHEEARRKLEEARSRQAQTAPPSPAGTAPPRPAGAPAPQQPQAKPVSQPAPAQETTYTVVSGDSLSKIAKRQLGDANAWKQIYEANKQLIGDDPDKIFPGQKLRIPQRAGGGKLA